MVGRRSRILAALAVLVGVLPMEGRAQPLGGFSFQLAPYCNVVTLSVRQDGSVYTLDGYDNQCGASARASASGMAFLNPNGTIGIGLTIVLPPGGSSVHVDASINPSTLAGMWSMITAIVERLSSRRAGPHPAAHSRSPRAVSRTLRSPRPSLPTAP